MSQREQTLALAKRKRPSGGKITALRLFYHKKQLLSSLEGRCSRELPRRILLTMPPAPNNGMDISGELMGKGEGLSHIVGQSANIASNA